MTTKTTPLAALAEHDEQIATAKTRVNALNRAIAEQQAHRAQLKADRVRAYADDDERAAAALKKKIDAADTNTDELRERQQGATIAATRAKATRDTWIAENVAALLDELRPDAEAARDELAAKVAELADARDRWHQVANHVLAIVRHSNIDAHTVPGIDTLDQAIRDVKNAASTVPTPLPHQPPPAVLVAPDAPPIVSTTAGFVDAR